MRIRIEDIDAFLAIVELSSFQRAADQLAITQSALSRRLLKLESFLGLKLLDRSTRTLQLTVVGQEFLPIAKRVVHDFESSLSEIQDIIQVRAGSVAISTNMTIAASVLPDILHRFKREKPDVRVQVFEGSSPWAIDQIVHGKVEFAIGQLTEARNDLEFEQLLRDDYVLVCHADNQLAKTETFQWRDFSGLSILKLNSTSATWHRLQGIFEENNITVTSDYEVSHLSALLGLVSKNLGVSIVPRFGIRRRQDSNLVIRPIENPKMFRVLGIARLKGRTLSPAAQALMALVREMLRAENKEFS